MSILGLPMLGFGFLLLPYSSTYLVIGSIIVIFIVPGTILLVAGLFCLNLSRHKKDEYELEYSSDDTFPPQT